MRAAFEDGRRPKPAIRRERTQGHRFRGSALQGAGRRPRAAAVAGGLAAELGETPAPRADSGPNYRPWVLSLLALSVLFLAALAWTYLKSVNMRRSSELRVRENERNQEAIMRLLDELSSLADGDLTVQATVTEDITGAIADSINYAIEALRELVTTINDSAIQLDGAPSRPRRRGAHGKGQQRAVPPDLRGPANPWRTWPPPSRRFRGIPNAVPMSPGTRSTSRTRAATRCGGPSTA